MMRGMRWRARLGLVPRDLEGFATLARARLREARGERSTWCPEQAILRVEGPQARVIALSPAYAAYRASHWRSRRSLLDRLLAPPPPIPDREAALPDLLPALRNRYRFANELRYAARHWTAGLAKVPTMRPLAEHLGIVLVHDLPETVSLVGDELLSRWGLGFEEGLDRAIRNLRARSNEDFVEVGPGLFASPWSDHHDAARLCLPDLFHRLPLHGLPVATVPNRQALLVTGDHDVRGLGALLDATRALMLEGRFVSGIPVRHDGVSWTPWAPDELHPSLIGWSELRVREIGAAYELQRDLLVGASSSPSVIAVPVGSAIRTGCFWPSEGAPLLPSVDLVLFDDGPGPIRAVPLAAVRERLPHLLERTDAWPPRWRAHRRPTPEELAPLEPRALRALS